MKNYLPVFFVVWLLVLSQVSYAQSISLASNPPESDASSAPVDAADVTRRCRGEILAEMLEKARSGISKTGLMGEARLSYKELMKFMPLLVESGLLEAFNGRLHTTPLYCRMDLDALPAALDLASHHAGRTHLLIGVEFLDAMSMPAAASAICYVTGVQLSPTGRDVLESLVRDGLAAKLQNGRVERYQITPKGQEYVSRVYLNLARLTAHAGKPGNSNV